MLEPTQHDIDILARTIYGEARGEYDHPQGGLAALIAVGNVIMNRIQRGGRFGCSIAAVCLKPYQFSCWNHEDPNLQIVKAAAPPTHTTFKLCLDVADPIAHNRWPDLTQGSNHYHASSCSPSWASPDDFKIKIGRHLFYKLG